MLWYQMLQTHGYNSPLKTDLEGECDQEIINTWLSLHLIYVGH